MSSKKYKPRKVDAKAAEDQVAKGYALEAETRAFGAEIDAALSGRDEQKADAAKRRTKADKLRTAAGLTTGEITDSHRQMLDAWIGSLESEHAGHTAKRRMKEAEGLEGRAEDGLSIEDHDAALAQIEKAHAYATERLDALAK